MRRVLVFVSVFLLATQVILSLSAKAVGIDVILKKCGEYCGRLQNVTLNFVCVEEVQERVFAGSRYVSARNARFQRQWRLMEAPLVVRRTNLTYDYQLIRIKGIVNETRTLLRENDREVKETNAELKTVSYWHKHIVLGPIGLLCTAVQKDYDYKFVKQGAHGGEPAYVIEAFPKPSVRTGYLFGKIWISQKDFSVLKIEWKQESLRDFDATIKSVENPYYKLDVLMVSEYGFEKNGIRFPSLHTVKEQFINKRNGKRARSAEIRVTYQDYKFFIVETDVKYR
jgi:hypothetical protein